MPSDKSNSLMLSLTLLNLRCGYQTIIGQLSICGCLTLPPSFDVTGLSDSTMISSWFWWWVGRCARRRLLQVRLLLTILFYRPKWHYISIKWQRLGQSRKVECGQPMTVQILTAKAIESEPCLHVYFSSQGFWRLIMIYKFIYTNEHT